MIEAELEDGRQLDPVMSLCGWQIEMRYAGGDGEPEGLVLFIPAVAGLDQSLSVPSVSFLFGVRSMTGWEFAAGPHSSNYGIGMCFTAGKTFRAGSMNLPVNLSYAMSDTGDWISLTFGWNVVK